MTTTDANGTTALGKIGDFNAVVFAEPGTIVTPAKKKLRLTSAAGSVAMSVEIDLAVLMEHLIDRGFTPETLDLWSHGGLDDKATDKITPEKLAKLDAERLMHVVVDQQFGYWSDPCGKSGHSLDALLTKTSRAAMKLLFKKLTGNNP